MAHQVIITSILSTYIKSQQNRNRIMPFTQTVKTTFLLLLLSANLFAQTDSTTEKESLPSRIMRLFEIKGEHNTTLLTPVFSYDPTSKISLGANSYTIIPPHDTAYSYIRPSSLGVYLKYSTANWIYAQAQLDHFSRTNWRILFDAKLNRAYERYYGIEAAKRPYDGIQFSSLQFYLEGSALKGVSKIHYLGLKYDIGLKRTKALENGSLPVEGGTYAGAGPVINIETRDDILYPTKGSFTKASALVYLTNSGGNVAYLSSCFDYRKYFHLWKGIISASQFYTELNTDLVPYIKMPKVFGQNRLRGISNDNKYIGQNMFYLQTELRRHVFGPFALVAFTGAGNVWSAWQDLPQKRLKYSYGGGLRMRVSKDNNLNGRLDMGFGPEGDMGIYILLREAF